MTAERPELRVGVLLAGESPPRWQCALVEALAAFCKPVLIRAPTTEGPGASGSWLYRLYRRADRARFASPDDPLAPCPLEDSQLESADLGGIGSQELDVLLCLARGDRAAALARYARHGAWLLELGGAGSVWPQWALSDEAAVASVTLRAFAPAGGGRVLLRSHVGLDRLSVHRTRAVAADRAARLMLRGLRRPAERGPEAPLPDPSPPEPSTGQTARRLLRLAGRAVRHRARQAIAEEKWYVAYRRLEAEPPSRGQLDFTLLRAPRDSYYADPFLIRHGDRHFVLFEDYRGRAGKGLISFAELGEDGTPSAPGVALELDCHLAYPFVFADGERIYMVPETRARRSVELYRAVRFPERWELDRVLLRDVDASDATLLRHGGLWWLFAAVAEDGGAPWDELFLFSSTSLDGEWTPHPGNPVVSDIRRARPAGRIFLHDGELIRPAQDCSRVYGWRTTLNRIERLDRTAYSERPIGRIAPARGSPALRTHSYSTDGRFEAVDGLWWQPRVALRRHPAGRLGRFRIEA